MMRHVGAALLCTALLSPPAGAWVSYYVAPTVVYPAPAPYCYPAPLPVQASWTYAYPPTYVMPLTVTPAVPTPAPPSKLPKVQMPPAQETKAPAPVVTEARSMTGTPPALAKDRCRVGFWNLTGKDVTLVVDGKARTLPRDRAVTLELAREFVWQVDQQPARSEHVAENKSAHEVVIR